MVLVLCSACNLKLSFTVMQRHSKGFWRPGRRLPFGAPKKNVIHQNLRNRLNCSQHLAI